MKLLKIAINIIIFICIFVFLDFLYSLYCYERLNNNSKKEYQNASKEKIEFYNSYIKPKYRYFKGVYNFKKLLKYNYETMKDTVEGNDKTKGSIIVFGGSFAYGAFLNQKDTLSYKLSKKREEQSIIKQYRQWALDKCYTKPKPKIFTIL